MNDDSIATWLRRRLFPRGAIARAHAVRSQLAGSGIDLRGDAARRQLGGEVRGFALTVQVSPGELRILLDAGGRVPLGFAAWSRDLRIEASQTLPGLSWLERKAPSRDPEKEWLARDQTTGDAEFDRRTAVRGDASTLAALLDHDARRALSGATAAGATVGVGIIERRLDDTEGTLSGNELARAIEAAVDLAAALSTTADPLPSRLAANARDDPAVGVRLHNLRLLLKHHPEQPGTTALCRDLRRSPESEVALLAAMHLGDEGLDTVAEHIGRAKLGDGVVLLALEHVDSHPAYPWRESLARLLDASASARILQAAAVIATSRGEASLLDRLAARGATLEARLVVELASILGPEHAPALEAALLEHLSRTAEPNERRLIVVTLGDHGSAAAVEPLRALEGSLPDRRTLRAIRAAVARIQNRLGPRPRGALALADPRPDAGAVSAADGAGDLSPVDPVPE